MTANTATLASVRKSIRVTVDADTYELLSESITTAGDYARTGEKFTARQTLAMVAILDATISGDADLMDADIKSAQKLWKLTCSAYKLAGLLSDGSPYFTHVAKLVRRGITSAEILDHLTNAKTGKIGGLSSLQDWAKKLEAEEAKGDASEGAKGDASEGDASEGPAGLATEAATILARMTRDAARLGKLLGNKTFPVVVGESEWSGMIDALQATAAIRKIALSGSAPAPKTTTRKVTAKA